MRLPCLILALAIPLSPALASTMDCVFNDSYEGESASTPALFKKTLDGHNCGRRTVQPATSPHLANLFWSTSLASSAQTWANGCSYGHNASGFGQNIYAGAYQGTQPANAQDEAVPYWMAEAADYNYASNQCSGPECLHYTQIVWRTTTQVGCGYKYCTTNSPFGASFPTWHYVVCNYSPSGNSGGRPY